MTATEQPECGKNVLIDGESVLCCTLPPDHDGAHYDSYDGVFWQTTEEVKP